MINTNLIKELEMIQKKWLLAKYFIFLLKKKTPLGHADLELQVIEILKKIYIRANQKKEKQLLQQI